MTPIVDVNPLVLAKRRRRREPSVALQAVVRAVPGTGGWPVDDFDVVVELTLLDEPLEAVLYRTSVRSFPGVDELVLNEGRLRDARKSTGFANELEKYKACLSFGRWINFSH